MFMALSVDVIDRRGTSNKMRRQLKPKKAKVRLHKAFIKQQKTFRLPFITNKTKCFSFKSGCVVCVENGKLHRQ